MITSHPLCRNVGLIIFVHTVAACSSLVPLTLCFLASPVRIGGGSPPISQIFFTTTMENGKRRSRKAVTNCGGIRIKLLVQHHRVTISDFDALSIGSGPVAAVLANFMKRGARSKLLTKRCGISNLYHNVIMVVYLSTMGKSAAHYPHQSRH